MPQESYNKLVEAILKGNKQYKGKDIDKYIDTEVFTSRIRVLFEKILKEIHDNSSENKDVLHKIRFSLGPAYGTNCIANLGFDSVHEYYQKHDSYSFEESGQTNFSRKIQVIAAEALHWWEEVYFVAIAVILPGHYEKHRKQYYDCFAFQCPNNKNGGAKWEKQDLDEVRKKYNETMKEYLKNGSSAMHSSHLKMDEGGAANGSLYRHTLFTPKAVYIGEVKSKTMENAREDAGSTTTTDSPYVTDVITPTYETLSSKGRKGNSANTHKFHEFHLSQGSETNFMNDAENISTIAHMYIIAKKRAEEEVLLLPPAYRRAMNALLQHLSVESVCEILGKRQKTLEKQSQMLNLLEGPLHSLTEALKTTDASAQRIRTVLYDSYGSFSSIAHRVAHYFDKGHSLREAGFSWEARHGFEFYATGEDPKNYWEVIVTILGIVLRIFGEDITNIKSAKELWVRVNDCLYSDDRVTENLKAVLKVVLFARSDTNGEEGKRDEDELWKELKKQADAIVENEKKLLGFLVDKKDVETNEYKYAKHWYDVVDRFKKILHSPYKPDADKALLLPLALILYQDQKHSPELNFQIKCCSKHYRERADNSDKKCECKPCSCKSYKYRSLKDVLNRTQEWKTRGLFSVYEMPFPQDSIFWAFIFRLSAISEIESVTVKHCRQIDMPVRGLFLTICFQSALYDDWDDFVNILGRTEKIINGEDLPAYALGASGGDKTNAWYQFAYCCRTLAKEWSASSTSSSRNRDQEDRLFLSLSSSQMVFSIKLSGEKKNHLEFWNEKPQSPSKPAAGEG